MQQLLVHKREHLEQFRFTDTDTRMVHPRLRLSPTAITAVHGAFPEFLRAQFVLAGLLHGVCTGWPAGGVGRFLARPGAPGNPARAAARTRRHGRRGAPTRVRRACRPRRRRQERAPHEQGRPRQLHARPGACARQFAAIVDLSKPALVQLLVDLATQVAAVGKAQDGGGGGKFSGELKGGPLHDFYKGVTGVCGEPNADIEKGESQPPVFPSPFCLWERLLRVSNAIACAAGPRRDARTRALRAWQCTSLCRTARTPRSRWSARLCPRASRTRCCRTPRLEDLLLNLYTMGD